MIVAKIGEVKYCSLQKAVDAAQNGDVITLVRDCAENVTVTQKADVNFTIDGAQKTMTGAITVDGQSGQIETAGLTIQNVKFDASNITTEASINLGVSGNIGSRYVSNLTVEGCTFIGKDQAKVAVKSYTGKEPFKGINPDECVAVGACIQGGVLAGDVKDLLLLDVAPLSLGIETLGGVFTRLIDRNTTIPTRKSQVFSTAEDGQTAVTIRVFQGEREMAQDNKLLGQFDLVGIPPAPRGMPQIEVTFDIDANGIVNVKAKDLGTNKEQTITITGSTGLSDEEIDKMVKEAEANKEADNKRKEEADLRNEAEQTIFATEKAIKDLGDKVDAADKEKAEKEIAELKELLTKDDLDAIKAKKEELNETAMKLATKVYEEAAKNNQTEEANAESTDNKDNVKDAEYEELMLKLESESKKIDIFGGEINNSSSEVQTHVLKALFGDMIIEHMNKMEIWEVEYSAYFSLMLLYSLSVAFSAFIISNSLKDSSN